MTGLPTVWSCLALSALAVPLAAAMPQGEPAPDGATRVRAIERAPAIERVDAAPQRGVIGAPLPIPFNGPIRPATWSGLAYDAANDVFMFASSEADATFTGQYTQAQRLSPDGVAVGPGLSVEGETYSYSSEARVVNVAARQAFVVFWQQVGKSQVGLLGMSFDATVGQGSTTYTIGPPNSPGEWAVSGDPTGVSTDAIAVWRPQSQTALRARKVTVGPTRVLTPGLDTEIATGVAIPTGVAISASTDASERRLVVYEKPSGARDIYGTIIDGNLQVVDAGPIADSAIAEQGAVVDGDGTKWLVVYRQGTGAATTVSCRGVYWNSSLGTAWVGPERTVAPAANASGLWVATAGDSYLVGYTVGTVRHLWSIDAFSCLSCEGEVLVTPAEAGFDLRMAVGPRESTSEVALVTGGTKLYRYRVDDGITTELGGGCGGGGKAEASCARIGNPNFELNLWDARASTPAFLVLSAGRNDFTCGACTIVPDLALGLVVGVGNTDGLGNASLALALPNDPNLIGAVLYQQWLLLSGSGCLGALETSRARRVQLQ